MSGIDHYGSFVAAILVFQAVPGAGTIAILDATARQGRAYGMAAVAGTIAGDFVYMIAAVAGLAAVLKTHPQVFLALQWGGAAYLCVMGLQLLRRRAATVPAASDPSRAPWSHCRRAFAVSVSNPKVILFFVAFFPLFVRPGSSAAALPLMMLHVSVLSLMYQTGLVLLGHAVTRRFHGHASARQFFMAMGGVALLGLGARLAWGIG